jgi:ATP-binding cassette subfamily F protein 3
LERFTERFHAQPNRASAVRNKRKMLDRLEEIRIPREKHSIRDFEFPETVESGYSVLTMSKIDKSYGEKQIYKGLDFEISKGQKLCLVGPNGAGKSTLLKMIAGVLTPDSGVRKLGHQVNLGYFSQTRLDVLNPSRTVFEELMSATERSVPQAQARTLLGVFNFKGDDVFKPVRVLSGGEKSRLILAKLLINPPNFICLDEPTTHLDIDGVEALTSCFQKYEGTLCFISHDLFFVKNIANHIVEVMPGELKNFHGKLDYYLEKKAGMVTPHSGQNIKATGIAKNKKLIVHSPGDIKNQPLKQAHQRHNEALKRLDEIKKLCRALETESKQLETESYVKSRFLSDAFGRDSNLIKEYGLRLKEIQKRIRDIVVILDQLQEEKIRISK